MKHHSEGISVAQDNMTKGLVIKDRNEWVVAMLDLASSNHCNDGHIYIQSRVCVCRYLFHRSESLDIDDRLADPWLERYICIL